MTHIRSVWHKCRGRIVFSPTRIPGNPFSQNSRYLAQTDCRLAITVSVNYLANPGAEILDVLANHIAEGVVCWNTVGKKW